MSIPTRLSLSASLLVVGLVASLAACSAAAGEETAAPDDGVVAVSGSDYGFDLGEDVAVGDQLELTNASDAEFHEMVLFRIADSEERSVDELLQLPEEESMASLTFMGVAGAAPGDDGEVVDGSLEVTEPGRYVLTCFIPEGADPDVVGEAFFGADPADGPPDFGDGAPHAMLGMVREFTVDG